MSSQTVARRYASALADVVSERNEAQLVQAELAAWARMISEHSALLEAFSNPTVAYFTCRVPSRVPRTTLSDHCFAIQNDGRDERATILTQEKCEWRLVGR